jgi:hypothetical protein
VFADRFYTSEGVGSRVFALTSRSLHVAFAVGGNLLETRAARAADWPPGGFWSFRFAWTYRFAFLQDANKAALR